MTISVLYLEDNPADAELAARAVQRELPGARVDVVATLAELRARLAEAATYDLLLCDLRLPDGSGLEALTDVRAAGLPLAVVVLTGSGDENAAVAALQAGADDYLVKRGDYLARLPTTLLDALARYRAMASRRGHELRVLYVEHNAFDIDLTRRHFARHAPHIVLDVVQDAAEALARLPANAGDDSTCDVLLLDYRLPSLDALELTKLLRQQRGLTLPVVLVTGHGSEDLAARALHLGVDDYLPKHPAYLYELPALLEKAHHQSLLLARERALEMAAVCALELLREVDPHAAIGAVLARLGEQTAADRVYVCECACNQEGNTLAAPCFHWHRAGLDEDAAGLPRLVDFDTLASAWVARLQTGQTISAARDEFPPGVGAALGGRPVGGLLLMPIILHDRFWGLLGFESLRVRREWARAEDSVLRIVAASLGAAIERVRALDELRQSATVFASTRDGVVITDLEGRIRAVNRAYCEMSGHSEAELLGRNPKLLRSGRHDAAFFAAMWQSIHATGQWQGEIWNRRKNGEVFPQWLTISTVRNDWGEPTHYVGVLTDISQLKQSEATLEHLAHYDPLTDLPNRILAQSRIQHALEQARRHERQVAVLFLDLDRFKTVNDSLGHPVGDELLTAIGRRLRERLRDEDTLARLGGDEFLVLIESAPGTEDIALVAQHLLDALEQPFHLPSGHEVFVGASLGISLYPQDGASVTELIQHADVAMYQAKEQGRNTYRFYTQALTRAANEKLELEASLRRALARGEFLLHYQPQVDVGSGAITGCEVLARWQPPDGGLISPARFIPVAEETGLIVALGEWVLRTACAQARAWMDAGLPEFVVSVNVSARQLRQRDLPQRVATILAETGLPPRRLALELTESVIMGQGDQAEGLLRALKQLGVGLSIDDFGTGYSSLAYLKRFPIDQLKIDQGFVRDIPHDRNDMEIAAAVIALGRSLNLKVLAEGVETPAQLDFLAGRGCDAYQGYLFSQPVTAEAFAALFGA